MTFTHCDTKRPDGCYVQFERLIKRDEDSNQTPPDEHSDGFWPSLEPGSAGQVKPEDFDLQMSLAHDRMDAWENNDWEYVGIRAQARCLIVQHGVGTYINFESAGLWGIESDSGAECLDEIYAQEVANLKDIIAAFATPIFEEETK